MCTAATLAYGDTAAAVNAAVIAPDRAEVAASVTARAFAGLRIVGRCSVDIRASIVKDRATLKGIQLYVEGLEQ